MKKTELKNDSEKNDSVVKTLPVIPHFRGICPIC
nr:MAG TPA: hypothetical protein [Caudoviricetes sp.]